MKRSQQSGMVLIVSLIFLLALTSVAVALLNYSTVDMKMSGASQEKVVAKQQAIGAVDQVIYQQKTGTNNFTKPLASFPMNVTVSAAYTTAEIEVNPNNEEETNCPPSLSPSSIGVFKCNFLRVNVNKSYGRGEDNLIGVRSGVVQEFLGTGT